MWVTALTAESCPHFLEVLLWQCFRIQGPERINLKNTKMPLLTWINDKRARSAATEVPFHLLKKISSYGDEKAVKENLLIQGDNLLALKALLPFYREIGRASCRERV